MYPQHRHPWHRHTWALNAGSKVSPAKDATVASGVGQYRSANCRKFFPANRCHHKWEPYSSNRHVESYNRPYWSAGIYYERRISQYSLIWRSRSGGNSDLVQLNEYAVIEFFFLNFFYPSIIVHHIALTLIKIKRHCFSVILLPQNTDLVLYDRGSIVIRIL